MRRPEDRSDLRVAVLRGTAEELSAVVCSWAASDDPEALSFEDAEGDDDRLLAMFS